MSVPDNGRRRPMIIAGVALAIALVAGVAIALVSVNGTDQRTSLSSDTNQIVTQTSAESTTTTTTTQPVSSTTVTTSSTTVTTSSTTSAMPRTTTKRVQTTTAPPVQAGGQTASDFETTVLSLVNKQRQANGCGDVRWDDKLAVAARKHSQDMAVRNYFDHNTPEGVDPWQRIKAEGYTNPSGENIAAGQSTPDAVMTSWMNSPGHRANILNCSFKALGVGMYKGGSYGIYWTQDFGYV